MTSFYEFAKQVDVLVVFFLIYGFIISMISSAIVDCQRQSEIVRKRRRNFVVFRRKGG